MIELAGCENLKSALTTHLDETRAQLGRVNEIMDTHGGTSRKQTCRAVKGIVEEGEILMENMAGNAVDAGLIVAAQLLKHYEIAAYGTARAFAEELGYDRDFYLLDETLEEESAANETLTTIATGGLFTEGVNEMAK